MRENALHIYYQAYGKEENRARFNHYRTRCADAMSCRLLQMWQSPHFVRFFFADSHIDFVDPLEETQAMADRMMEPKDHSTLPSNQWQRLDPVLRMKENIHQEIADKKTLWNTEEKLIKRLGFHEFCGYPMSTHNFHSHPLYAVDAIVALY